MSRTLPLVLVIIGVGVMLGAVLVLRPADGAATRDDRVQALAAGLRCPDCQGLSVADSATPAAAEIRRQIGVQLDAGRSDDEIRRHFVERYGDWILLAPSSPVAWWLPVVVLALGIAALLAWLRGGRSGERPMHPAAAISPAERRVVREEAEVLDA